MTDLTAAGLSADADLLLRANQCIHQSDHRTALDLYLQFVERFGEDAGVDAAVAFCYYIVGFSDTGTHEDRLKAVEWGERAIALELGNASLYADLGEYYMWALLDYERAAQAYRRAIELDPYSIRSYLGASSLYGVPEDVVSLQESICWLEHAVDLAPREAIWRILLAERYEEAGRATEAKREAIEALLCHNKSLSEGDIERVRKLLLE